MPHAVRLVIQDILEQETRFNLGAINQPLTLELYTALNDDTSTLSLDLIYTVNDKRCLVWTLEIDTVNHCYSDSSSLFQGPVAEMMVGMAVPAMAMLEDSKRLDLVAEMKSYQCYRNTVT